MNRRSFLLGATAALVTPPVRRVYSFLWDNPLVVVPDVDFRALDSELARTARCYMNVDYAALERRVMLRLAKEYLTGKDPDTFLDLEPDAFLDLIYGSLP